MRRTTTKAAAMAKRSEAAQRGARTRRQAYRERLSNAEDTSGGTPITVVPALSGSEVLWFTRHENAVPPITVERAPIIAWLIAPGDDEVGSPNFVEPVTVEKHGSFYVIRHGNGAVADPFSGQQWANEDTWLAFLQQQPTPSAGS